MLAVIGAMVLVCVWTYRASSNAHQLGAQGLRYSPRWAVAGYFIPVGNLWMPYQAMKEILQASRNPAAWQSQGWPQSLPVWWLLWLAAGFTTQLYGRKLLSANTVDALVEATWVGIVAAALRILAAFFLAKLVQEICAMQVARADREHHGAQELPGGASAVE
jgi:hypothetical protein